MACRYNSFMSDYAFFRWARHYITYRTVGYARASRPGQTAVVFETQPHPMADDLHGPGLKISFTDEADPPGLVPPAMTNMRPP
jgi:hypothetical protein